MITQPELAENECLVGSVPAFPQHSSGHQKKPALTSKETPYSDLCSPFPSLHPPASQGDEQNHGHKFALLRYMVIKGFDN